MKRRDFVGMIGAAMATFAVGSKSNTEPETNVVGWQAERNPKTGEVDAWIAHFRNGKFQRMPQMKCITSEEFRKALRGRITINA